MFAEEVPATDQKEILIVDDSPDVLEILTLILMKHGYRVRSAETGGIALRSVAVMPPDLILLDVRMPDLDGFEVCRALKADARSRDIPVLFISAMDEIDQKVKGFQAGAVDYLIKPFETAEVLARIKTQVQIRDLTNSLREAKESLEKRVEERTAELARTNVELQAEITERKRAEEQIKSLNQKLSRNLVELAVANKELESFSYSVSHDLRAPLRSIEGFCEALMEDNGAKLDEEGRDHLLRIRKASRRMVELIDGMLKLSRVTRSEMKYEVVDLSGLAREVVDELSRTQPQRTVSFIIRDEVRANGDPDLLRAALENLLGNAWKFTGKCPDPRIEFGMAHRDKVPVYYVSDNGVGFDAAYSEKLFAPFQRLHSLSEFPGTGIGLATVQRIIRRHGGQIWSEGKKGQGASFFFTL